MRKHDLTQQKDNNKDKDKDNDETNTFREQRVWEHLLPRVEIEWRTEWKTDITYFCQKSHSTPSTSGRGKSASWRNNGPSNFPVEIQLQFLLWDPFLVS